MSDYIKKRMEELGLFDTKLSNPKEASEKDSKKDTQPTAKVYSNYTAKRLQDLGLDKSSEDEDKEESYIEKRMRELGLDKSSVNVDKNYINSFIADVNAFLKNAETEYGGFSVSKASSIYDSHDQKFRDLSSRSGEISSYIQKNRDKISAESYNELMSQLDEINKAMHSTHYAFYNAKEYYSQWKTEYEYELYHEAVKKAEEYAELWNDISWGYDPTKHSKRGQKGWDEYVAYQEQAAQRKAQQEAEKSFWEKLAEWIGDIGSDSTLPLHLSENIKQGYKDAEERKKYPDDRWTEEEKRNFGYIWDRDKESAYSFASALNNKKNVEQEKQRVKEIQGSATDNFWSAAGHTIGAILSSSMGLADWMGDLYAMDALGYIPEADGELTPFEYSQAVTSGISNHLNTEYGTLDKDIPVIGGKGWGDVYSLGTSIAQSSLTAATGGQAQTLIAFFGSGAAASVDDAKRRGASDEQALAYGTMVGLAEGLSEMLGVDNLMKIKSSATMKQLMGNILKQAVAEGLEEGISTTLSNFADQLVMGDKSNFNILVTEFMAQGMSEEEAKEKAWLDMAEDLAYDMVGGFVSGGVHAGKKATKQYVAHQVNTIRTGKSIKQADGGVDSLKALANEVAGASDAKMQADLTKQVGKVNKRATAGKVGRLFNTVRTANNLANASANQADLAKSFEEKGFSTEMANNLAEALVASYNKQTLTNAQKKLLKSVRENQVVRDIVSSIMYTDDSTMGQRSQNIRDFQNDVALGRIAKAAGVSVEEVKKVAEGTATPVAENGTESHYEVSADGKTIDSDGNDVSIKGISSIKDGRLVLETEDGNTIDASDISYGSQTEALVYESVASLEGIIDTATADKLSKHLMKLGGATSNVYVNGIVQAYTYGYYGYGREAMLGNNTLSSTLTEAQRNVAYGLGEQYRNAKTEADQAAAKSATVAKKSPNVDKNNSTAPDGNQYKKVRFEGEVKKWSKKQKAEVEFIDFIASNFSGNTVHVFESYKDEKGRYVYKDSNGNIHAAPNGMYFDSNGDIYLDLNAGNHGEGLVMNTFAHELYHHIQRRSPAKAKKLAEFLVQELGYENVEEAVQRQVDKAERAGHDVAYFMERGMSRSAAERLVYDRAFNDFVADSLETMFTEGDVVSKLQKLKSQDEDLVNTIKNFINKWVNKLRKFYSNHSTISVEGDMVAHLEKFEQIQQMFAEALVDAGENFQSSLTPGMEGIMVNQNGDPVAHSTDDGTIQLSMRTYEEDGRDAFRAYLQKCVTSKKLTKAEMQEMLDGIEEIYQTCKEFKDKYAPFSSWSDAAVVRDTYGKPVFSVVTPNGDYKMNLDFSLVCKKRRTLDAVFNEMSKRGIIDNFELGQKSVVKINEIIRRYGLETACALCFVDAKRFRQASMADSFTSLYNELVESLVPEDQRSSIERFNFSGYETIKKVENGIHTWDKSKLDFSHIDHVLKTYGDGTVEYKAAKYIKTHAEGRKLLLRGDFMSSQGFDAVKSQNPDVLKLYNSKKGTGGPKAAFGDVQYMNEIIQKARWWTPAKAYSVGGVRIQSFSDYVPRMVFDYVQMVYDLAATKLPAHAYTKEALFVKQFGLTGIKINMSLIPAIAEGGIAPGLDANGNYVWAGESFDYETAKEIQNAEGYTENCGTICVGVSYEHIVKLLRDPNIRMVIPYHKSGLNPIVAHMNKIAEFTDYTNDQRTKGKDGKALEKDFDFSKALHDMGKNASPKAVADQYLKWCAAHGYTPRFAEFAMEDNYYKLLEDFTLYDKDGNYVPQREVRAVFPKEGSAFGSMKSLIETGLQEDAVIEGKRDSSLSAIVDEIEKTLPKTEAEISEDQVEQADRDLEADTKLSDRDYSYESLTSKPDMKVTIVGGSVPKNRADVAHMAKQNAATVGKFDPKTGSVSVHVDDIGTDVVLSTKGLRHGLRRTNGPLNVPNYVVTVKAGEILKNSIRINEITPSDENVKNSYVLLGVANDANGTYVVRFVVNHFDNSVASMDVLYAINAKKEPAALNAPRLTAKPLSVTGSTISIAELLDYVNQHFPDILPEDVLKHYGHDARPNGELGESALYSDRDYMDAVNRGDKESAKKMVDQYAIEQGFSVDADGVPELLFHGTDSFGFTKIDTSASDDGITFWATPNMGVAGSYYEGSNYKIREIGKEKVAPKGEKLSYYNSMEKVTNAAKPFSSELGQDLAKMKYIKEAKVMKKNSKTIRKAVDAAETVMNGNFPDPVKKIAEKIIQASEIGTYDAWSKTISQQKWQKFEEITGVDFSEISLPIKFNPDNPADISKVTQADPDVFRMMYYIGDVLDGINMDEWGALKGQEIHKYDIIESYNDYVAEKGIYGFYHKQSNPFVYDCGGVNWNRIAVPAEAKGYFTSDVVTTRQLAEWAFDNGYDAIRLDNVVDVGGYSVKEANRPATVWAFKNPESQLKSADPITYDDNGNVIPLSERFNTKNDDIRYSDRDYVAYDRTAILKESKVDEYLMDYAAKHSPKYAQAHIAYIRPETFLKLTTDDWMERDHISEQAGDLDEEKLTASRPGIYLRIDPDTGKVIGHEGRHRMAAMEKAGIYYVPVLLVDTSTNMTKTDLDEIVLRGQFNRFEIGIARDAIPLNFENRDRVIKNFATQSSVQRIGERIGHNKTLRFSDRDSESVSNRSLLANAFEGVAQNDIEKQKIQEYKSKIDLINAEEQKLTELNEQIKELSFSKGPKDTKAIRDLQFEARQTANRISTYDKQLLRLEASKPLQDVLDREKKMAYKRAEQKGKDALAAYKEKSAKTQRELLEKWQESRKKGIESRGKTAMRHKIQSVVGELNQLLLSNDKKHHVPDSLKKAVADALALVNMDTVGAEERAAKYAALIAKETDPDKIDAYQVTMENILRQGEKMGQRLKELRDAYDEIQNSDDPDIANAYDPVIAGSLKELSQTIGDTSLRDMSIEQLQDVYDMYRMVLTRVRDANKSFLNAKNESISKLASSVVHEVKRAGGEHQYRTAILDSARTFFWNNLKPVYAMEHIGSATMTDAFNNVRRGEDTWAKDVTEARAYYTDKAKKYGYDSWDFKKKYRFKSTSEMEFELTLEQILSLYAYSKRDQAHDHLRLGGFVFDSNIETYKENGSKLLKYKVNTADAHQITPEILASITGTLTKEQMAFVDEMQDYLSTVMGAKGNEVTMAMYGVKLFKEKFYFPLKSAKQFMFEQNEVSGEVKIKNSGFTNKVVAKANNPVILNNFMDVWANHVNDMSMYHAFVLPLEDFNRIFNYNSPKQEGKPPVSVKGTIQSAYSPAAVNYVKQLITDLNGGAMSDPRETFAKSMTAKFKKAKVFSSLSVVIQQPSAIGRAFALVDPKYFRPTKDGMNHDKLWAELKQYAPVAVIKEMGYFDTNMGRSTLDFIKAKEYSTFKEKAKAIFADSDYRDEILSKAPALADEMTWCAIWNAVKRETVAKHNDLRPGSEEFLKAAGERFTEVVTKTQVYDSVLARSANMRSKSGLMSMVTSFMAEPTTSINMLEDAIRKGKRGYKGYAAKAFASVAVSVILNNALVSLVYAMRDDDEDETFLEKYMQSFTSNTLDDINPITYYPFLKDMWSLLQGYSVERSDMSLISDIADSFKGVVEDGDAESWWDLAGAIANIGGVPMENIRRDVNGAINFFNTIVDDVNGRETTWGSLGDAIADSAKNSLPVIGWLPAETKADKLYDAIVSGDTEYVNRMKGSYKTEDAYHSAVRKALRENDPRIREAAVAWNANDLDEYMRIAKEIIAEKHFVQDDVVMAIRAAANSLSPDEGTSSTSNGKGLFTAEKFASAIAQGDQATAYAIKTDIIQTAQKNGKTAEQAEKSFNSSAKSELKEMFLAGEISEQAVINALTTYCGADEDDALADVQYWAFKQKYPDVYADDSWFDKYYDEVADSGISIDMYMDYRNQVKDITGEGKKERRMAVIDSLPISRSQKDALYYAEGWTASKLYEAPWH